MSIVASRRLLLQAAAASLAAGAPAIAHQTRLLPKVPTSELIEARMRLKAKAGRAPTVVLTLDACPGGFDTRIADVLVEYAIPATIFVTGAWMRRHPDHLAMMLSRPDIFGLENHGDHHLPPVIDNRRLFGLQCAPDLAAVQRDVVGGASDIQKVTGARPLWYRAATGYYSRAAMTAIEGWGYAIGGYSLNGDQGASLPGEQVEGRIAAARDGDVIISHINQPERPSGAGVAEGILALRRRGMHFARLDQLAPGELLYEA